MRMQANVEQSPRVCVCVFERESVEIGVTISLKVVWEIWLGS